MAPALEVVAAPLLVAVLFDSVSLLLVSAATFKPEVGAVVAAPVVLVGSADDVTGCVLGGVRIQDLSLFHPVSAVARVASYKP